MGGVNFKKKYQNLVVSKCGKNQNKIEVAEEMGVGDSFKMPRCRYLVHFCPAHTLTSFITL